MTTNNNTRHIIFTILAFLLSITTLTAKNNDLTPTIHLNPDTIYTGQTTTVTITITTPLRLTDITPSDTIQHKNLIRLAADTRPTLIRRQIINNQIVNIYHIATLRLKTIRPGCHKIKLPQYTLTTRAGQTITTNKTDVTLVTLKGTDPRIDPRRYPTAIAMTTSQTTPLQ